MSYTKEPWVVAKGRTHNKNIVIEDSCGECIALVMEGGISDEKDARRIVACVNACAGLPTELIEKHGVTRSGIAKGVEGLENQRDALLNASATALRALIFASAHVDGDDFVKVMMARDEISATIASVKGAA